MFLTFEKKQRKLKVISWKCKSMGIVSDRFLNKKGVDGNPPPVFKIQYPMKICLGKYKTDTTFFKLEIHGVVRK